MSRRQDPRRRYSAIDRFAWAEGQLPLYDGQKPRHVMPRPGYVRHMVREGDRLDRLAQDYFGDPRLWWVIAEANPGLLTPADLLYLTDLPSTGSALRIGSEIRIPPRPETP